MYGFACPLALCCWKTSGHRATHRRGCLPSRTRVTGTACASSTQRAVRCTLGRSHLRAPSNRSSPPTTWLSYYTRLAGRIPAAPRARCSSGPAWWRSWHTRYGPAISSGRRTQHGHTYMSAATFDGAHWRRTCRRCWTRTMRSRQPLAPPSSTWPRRASTRRCCLPRRYELWWMPPTLAAPGVHASTVGRSATSRSSRPRAVSPPLPRRRRRCSQSSSGWTAPAPPLANVCCASGSCSRCTVTRTLLSAPLQSTRCWQCQTTCVPACGMRCDGCQMSSAAWSTWRRGEWACETSPSCCVPCRRWRSWPRTWPRLAARTRPRCRHRYAACCRAAVSTAPRPRRSGLL
mmetsp:Transcript_15613/g.48868  ORF Transcript_15613/g.48868 Transcript_15613/m.48868 type:complete len:346 (-) Transcript_15613:1314-2351(-)